MPPLAPVTQPYTVGLPLLREHPKPDLCTPTLTSCLSPCCLASSQPGSRGSFSLPLPLTAQPRWLALHCCRQTGRVLPKAHLAVLFLCSDPPVAALACVHRAHERCEPDPRADAHT